MLSFWDLCTAILYIQRLSLQVFNFFFARNRRAMFVAETKRLQLEQERESRIEAEERKEQEIAREREAYEEERVKREEEMAKREEKDEEVYMTYSVN